VVGPVGMEGTPAQCTGSRRRSHSWGVHRPLWSRGRRRNRRRSKCSHSQRRRKNRSFRRGKQGRKHSSCHCCSRSPHSHTLKSPRQSGRILRRPPRKPCTPVRSMLRPAGGRARGRGDRRRSRMPPAAARPVSASERVLRLTKSTAPPRKGAPRVGWQQDQAFAKCISSIVELDAIRGIDRHRGIACGGVAHAPCYICISTARGLTCFSEIQRARARARFSTRACWRHDTRWPRDDASSAPGP